ncbi:MAG: PrsW family intramembrane metalloprotease [Anaerolineales bacterium]|nr:PrsW family intramembrane metalloprotease [Anaerolineales bacterium]
MDSQPRGSDWRSILLLIFSLSGVLLAVSAAIGTLMMLAVNENVIREVNPSPLATVLTASSLIAIGLLLLPIAWLSLKRLRGQEFETFSLPSLRPWAWILIPGLWLLFVILATLLWDAPGANWYVPFLYFFAIAIPIYLVIRIAINRIALGSSQRVWGVFASGMTLSPMLAVIAEGIVIIFGLIVFGVYLALNPEKMSAIERLVNQIQQAPDLDSLVFLIGPLLKNPLTLITALTLLSVFVPVIEETFKSLGVWLVMERLSTPAQGFALGILSGAGFALSESLFASVAADETWGITLTTRAISGAMHMLAAGLVGWGIAYARLEKRYIRLFGLTFLAMLLHGAWNAGAVLSMAGGVGIMLSMPEFDIVSSILALGGVGLLFLLMSGMFVALFVINARLRGLSPSPTQPTVHLPLPPPAGEEVGGEGGGR